MKRVFDFILSLLMLIVLSPLLLILALLVRLDSPGSAIFKQKRLGKGGQEFTLYKFRTMRVDCPDTPTNGLKNRDSYITRVGRFLRTTSLDELPQLFNIFRGDMSFVGPRPVIAEEKELVEERKERDVYKVKPGVTGLAQIHGRDHVPPEQKARLDARYVHKHSLWLDIKIIFRTAVVVLKRDGVLENHSSTPDTLDKQREEVAVEAEE